jgi:hypothetical protein
MSLVALYIVADDVEHGFQYGRLINCSLVKHEPRAGMVRPMPAVHAGHIFQYLWAKTCGIVRILVILRRCNGHVK